MKQIDEYSYQCGVMDCFSEMVKAGLKRIALSHPSSTKEIRDQYIPFAENICVKYQIHYYLDDDPLITDLFPASMNQNTYNIIFYKDENDIEEYRTLKKLKVKVIENKEYEKYRYEIAYRFGKLLSYSDETIQNYIQNNDEKE
ncbi:hypothetical protein [Traorella massiliensis]|uniref:hypothetical protein n=1 Tax=Traorella massiliensis TaxID=1903263 RepID=UPI0008F8DE88|nr:hypothetical protein [Traorella massiliensis]